MKEQIFYIPVRAGRKAKRIKRLKTVAITILIIAALITLFFILNGLANAWRGYKSIGGEVFVFLIPFIIVVIRDCIHDFINRMK